MNEAQIEVLSILASTAIDTIAELHNTTADMVKIALESGHKIVCQQFQKLMAEGIKTADSTVSELQVC